MKDASTVAAPKSADITAAIKADIAKKKATGKKTPDEKKTPTEPAAEPAPAAKKTRPPRDPRIAAITRFVRDWCASPAAAHLSVARLRAAVLDRPALADAIIQHGSLVWRDAARAEALDSLIASIPPVARGRRRMTDEEKAAHAKNRRSCLLSTAMTADQYSRAALRTGYLQGLHGDERTAAGVHFDETVAAGGLLISVQS